jgi:class 3 adenylate cyclase
MPPGSEAEKVVLVGCNGHYHGRSFEISRFPCVIGRAPDCDVALVNDRFASGWHCRIKHREGEIWIEDANSTNGTFHNGARITEPELLVAGRSVICVGRTRLALLAADASGPEREEFTTQAVMTAGSIVIPGVSSSAAAAMREALLVMDLCDSTQLALEHGESSVCRCVALLTQALEASPAGPGILFLKCTGDGFFATFPDCAAALRGARILLDWCGRHGDDLGIPGLGIRFGVHVGEVQTDSTGDRLGLAANLTFRLQGAKPDEAVIGADEAPDLPAANRILLTGDAVAELGEGEAGGARRLGTFQFKGFDSPSEVWLWCEE